MKDTPTPTRNKQDIREVNKTLDGAVILIAYHKSFAQAAEEALTSFGFTACPYAEDSRSGEEVLRDLNEKKQEYKKKAQATDGGLTNTYL